MAAKKNVLRIQPNTVYLLGDLSPAFVLHADDTNVYFKDYPYRSIDKKRQMPVGMFWALVERAAEKTQYKYYKDRMKKLLRGESVEPEGRSVLPVRVEAIASEMTYDKKRLWRAAGDYGNVGWFEVVVDGLAEEGYEIETTFGELAKLEKDKRFIILSVEEL